MAIFLIVLKNGQYLNSFYGLLALPILFLFFYLYKKFKNQLFLQELYVLNSIIFPFMTGTYFFFSHYYDSKTDLEFYIGGMTFQMFLSFLLKFRINWYNITIARLACFFFIIAMNITKEGKFSDQAIILAVLIICCVYFDFIQDRYDRTLWEKEYVSSRENEIFHSLIEEIPDQVIVWRSNQEIIYANKSTFEVFRTDNFASLKKLMEEKIEVIKFEDKMEKSYKKSNFLIQINQVFQNKKEENIFSTFSAFIKLDFQNKNEYDIKMKKIFWAKEEAVLILLSKVDEKNLNARLDYVDSFLNYILGNVSHDIYTPLNVLLGMIENINNTISDKKISKQLLIAINHGEILVNIVRIMIDLFNIRKGSLLMNISEFSIKEETKNVLEIFSDLLNLKKIKCCFDPIIPPFIRNDVVRFREILIVILNNCLKSFSQATLRFKLNPSDSLENSYEMNIELEGENDCESESPKSLRNHLFNKLSFDSKIFDLGLSFSMVDFLILCISKGEGKRLEMTNVIKNRKIIINYCFKISDVNDFNEEILNDPFQDQHTFTLKFANNDNHFVNNGMMFGSLSEFKLYPSNQNIFSCKSINSAHQTPISSPNQHKWPDLPGLNCFNFTKSPVIYNSSNFDGKKNIQMYSNEETQMLSSRKITVLNVDDVQYNLMVISNFCQTFGIQVEEAKNGQEAFNITKEYLDEKKQTFDIIFMDCDMPIMDGFEASKKINELYVFLDDKKPPIIAITANVANEDVSHKCKNSGIIEIIMKPLGIKRFKQVMNKYLNLNL